MSTAERGSCPNTEAVAAHTSNRLAGQLGQLLDVGAREHWHAQALAGRPADGLWWEEELPASRSAPVRGSTEARGRPPAR